MREKRFRQIAVGVAVAGTFVTVSILVPPPGGGEDRTRTETDDGSGLTAEIRVIDPDRDSVAPPLLPNGMAQEPDEPYGSVILRGDDPRLIDPEGFLRGDYENLPDEGYP